MGASLDQLGVPQEMRERAKIMWILTIFAGVGSWILINFIWKVPGQEQNQWFQFHLKQNLFVGLIVTFLGWTGIGWLFAAYVGFMAFSAIGKGEDYEAPVVGGMSR